MPKLPPTSRQTTRTWVSARPRCLANTSFIMCGAWWLCQTVSWSSVQSARMDRPSSVTPVWRPLMNVSSTTTSAPANAASVPPPPSQTSKLRVKARLSRNSGNNGGAASAASASGRGVSSSQSTCTSAAASSACGAAVGQHGGDGLALPGRAVRRQGVLRR